jgi:aryl-alcohol dehydrogenase-like predicted oxidoreductase
MTMANFALRWILDHEAVSCVIPGARIEQQVVQNVVASDLPRLNPEQEKALAALYETKISALVHQRW